MSSSLTGNRVTSFRYELLSSTEASKGDLDGVTDGSLDWSAAATIKGGGSLTIVDVGQSIDFLNDRIKPYITINGSEYPLGIYLFTEAPESWMDTGRSWACKLLDKTTILDQIVFATTYVVAAGTVITTAVSSVITGSTSETNIAITASAKTLAGDMTWDPGTSALKIINDLLDAAGYFSLFCNENGQFRGEAYRLPASRPIEGSFQDGPDAIFLPDFTKDVDLFSIPNTFVAVGQGNGATAALTSTATNTDPTSPYSTVSRGRTISAVETGVEAADQTTLDNYAKRRLVELTSVTATVEVQHMYVPGLTINDAVFASYSNVISARHVVKNITVPLNPLALTKTKIQQVVDL